MGALKSLVEQTIYLVCLPQTSYKKEQGQEVFKG